MDWSTLLAPETFLSVCSGQIETISDHPPVGKDSKSVRARYSHNYVVQELAAAAAYIDPAIDPSDIADLPYFTNRADDLRLSIAYYNICARIAGKSYTDIVLFPFLSKGGGEKYIIDFLNTVEVLEPGRTYLFLLGESIGDYHWLGRLPPRSDVLDLFDVSRGLAPAAIDLLTLRIVQHCGDTCRIYMKNSAYVDRFFRLYGSALCNMTVIYFRFSDPVVPFLGRPAFRGFGFDFLSSCGGKLSLIISDNQTIARHDCERLDAVSSKYHVLYARCQIEEHWGPRSCSGLKKAVLWASRLDPEKRPDLLLTIAGKLYKEDPSISIDVYGSSMSSNFDLDLLSRHPNIRYRGPFADFADIPTGRYDLFLYTSAYDGLPNVALEAMAHGLPVLAANVGGVCEVVTSETGILLDNVLDEVALSESFVRTLVLVYSNQLDIGSLSTRGLALIRRQHSRAAHVEKVSRILEEISVCARDRADSK
jgi:glycosyltransferase involved in cell wall biosynthesis